MAREIEEKYIDDILIQERYVRIMDVIDTQSFLEILQCMSSLGEIPQIIDRRKVDKVRRRLFVDEDLDNQNGSDEAGQSLVKNKEKQSLDSNIKVSFCDEELDSSGKNSDPEPPQGK